MEVDDSRSVSQGSRQRVHESESDTVELHARSTIVHCTNAYAACISSGAELRSVCSHVCARFVPTPALVVWTEPSQDCRRTLTTCCQSTDQTAGFAIVAAAVWRGVSFSEGSSPGSACKHYTLYIRTFAPASTTHPSHWQSRLISGQSLVHWKFTAAPCSTALVLPQVTVALASDKAACCGSPSFLRMHTSTVEPALTQPQGTSDKAARCGSPPCQCTPVSTVDQGLRQGCLLWKPFSSAHAYQHSRAGSHTAAGRTALGTSGVAVCRGRPNQPAAAQKSAQKCQLLHCSRSITQCSLLRARL